MSMSLKNVFANGPQSLPPDFYRKSFQRFLEEYEYHQVVDLLTQKTTITQHLSFHISSYDLIQYDSIIGHFTINHPKLLLPIFEEALTIVQVNLLSHPSFQEIYGQNNTTSVKANIHIRFTSIPNTSTYIKSLISDIRANDIGPLLHISGTIIKTSAIKLLEMSKQYECKRYKCRHRFRVYADPEQDNQLPHPRKCPSNATTTTTTTSTTNNNEHNATSNSSSSSNGNKLLYCPSTEFIEVNDSKICIDYQEIKIQDKMENLGIGATPRTMIVVLTGDLVDKYHTGDKVSIIGYLIKQWRYLNKGDRCLFQTIFYCNSIMMSHNSTSSSYLLSTPSPSLMPTSRPQSLSNTLNNSNLLDTNVIGSRLICDLPTLRYHTSFQSFWSYWRKEKRDLFTGRDLIVKSVCPKLYGMYWVKLAVLLTLIGGSQQNTSSSSATSNYNSSGSNNDKNKKNTSQLDNNTCSTSANPSTTTNNTSSNSNMRVRTQSHLLLVGDPGCGKSQILRFIAQLLPRAVLTTGIGTTGAGLTCSAVREGNEWTLEAGALVLANEGVCCIDEFGSIKTQDRAMIHEAMEQQTVSVAKAGIVTKLSTKATVIATCNPKGTYDLNQDISTNTAIATPLLSRFDLILILLDQTRLEWDQKISTYLLTNKLKKTITKRSNPDVSSDINLQFSDRNTLKIQKKKKKKKDLFHHEETWPVERLRHYLEYIQLQYNPTISHVASELLMKFYHIQRQAATQSLQQQSTNMDSYTLNAPPNPCNMTSTRATVRLLESLIRLSQAHAKLLCQQEVLLHDAIIAIYCVSLSNTDSISLENTAKVLQSEFPQDSYQQYLDIECKIFTLLGCTKQMFLSQLIDFSADKKLSVPPPPPPPISSSLSSSSYLSQKSSTAVVYHNLSNSHTHVSQRAEKQQKNNIHISTVLDDVWFTSQNNIDKLDPVIRSVITDNQDDENFGNKENLKMSRKSTTLSGNPMERSNISIYMDNNSNIHNQSNGRIDEVPLYSTNNLNFNHSGSNNNHTNVRNNATHSSGNTGNPWSTYDTTAHKRPILSQVVPTSHMYPPLPPLLQQTDSKSKSLTTLFQGSKQSNWISRQPQLSDSNLSTSISTDISSFPPSRPNYDENKRTAIDKYASNTTMVTKSHNLLPNTLPAFVYNTTLISGPTRRLSDQETIQKKRTFDTFQQFFNDDDDDDDDDDEDDDEDEVKDELMYHKKRQEGIDTYRQDEDGNDGSCKDIPQSTYENLNENKRLCTDTYVDEGNIHKGDNDDTPDYTLYTTTEMINDMPSSDIYSDLHINTNMNININQDNIHISQNMNTLTNSNNSDKLVTTSTVDNQLNKDTYMYMSANSGITSTPNMKDANNILPVMSDSTTSVNLSATVPVIKMNDQHISNNTCLTTYDKNINPISRDKQTYNDTIVTSQTQYQYSIYDEDSHESWGAITDDYLMKPPNLNNLPPNIYKSIPNTTIYPSYQTTNSTSYNDENGECRNSSELGCWMKQCNTTLCDSKENLTDAYIHVDTDTVLVHGNSMATLDSDMSNPTPVPYLKSSFLSHTTIATATTATTTTATTNILVPIATNVINAGSENNDHNTTSNNDQSSDKKSIHLTMALIDNNDDDEDW